MTDADGDGDHLDLSDKVLKAFLKNNKTPKNKVIGLEDRYCVHSGKSLLIATCLVVYKKQP